MVDLVPFAGLDFRRPGSIDAVFSQGDIVAINTITNLLNTLKLTDFDVIHNAIDGFSAAKLKSGKWIIVNQSNMPISIQTYDNIITFSDIKKFLVKLSGAYVFLDAQGFPVDDERYTKVESLKDRRYDSASPLFVGYQGQEAYLIESGKKISEREYGDISRSSDNKFIVGSGTGAYKGKECIIFSPTNITERFNEIEFFDEDLFVAIGKKIGKGTSQIVFLNDQGKSSIKGSFQDCVYLKYYHISDDKILVQIDAGRTVLDTKKGKITKNDLRFDHIDGGTPEKRAHIYSSADKDDCWSCITLSSSGGVRPAAANFSSIGDLYVSEDDDWHRDAEPPFRLFKNTTGNWIFTENNGELLAVPKNIIKLQWICPYFESSHPYRPYHIKGTLDNGKYIYLSAEYFSGFSRWDKKQYDILTIKKQREKNVYVIEGIINGSRKELYHIQDPTDPIDIKDWK